MSVIFSLINLKGLLLSPNVQMEGIYSYGLKVTATTQSILPWMVFLTHELLECMAVEKIQYDEGNRFFPTTFT